MTFNQWCGGRHFESGARLALETIWNGLIGAGYKPAQVSAMLTDLLDNFRERRS